MGQRRHEAAGAIHHVCARGAKKHLVFHDDLDRRMYLASLGQTVRQQRWNLLAYCLMENHVHLVIETTEPNLGEGMCAHHGPYALRFNRRHGLSGHVFESRYRAKRIKDDQQLWTALYYVDHNPVKAHFCKRPEDWRWGSAWAIDRGEAPAWLATERLREHHDGTYGPTPGTGAPA